MGSESWRNIIAYIKKNPVAVLGTANSSGNLAGAAVYIVPLAMGEVAFVTKKATQKFQNLETHPQVSLTILNTEENSTLQADGAAQVVDDGKIIDLVMEKLTKVHAKSADVLPPLLLMRYTRQ